MLPAPDLAALSGAPRQTQGSAKRSVPSTVAGPDARVAKASRQAASAPASRQQPAVQHTLRPPQLSGRANIAEDTSPLFTQRQPKKPPVPKQP